MAKDEQTASPNYVYILFEAAALTLTYVKDDRAAFALVEDQLTTSLNFIIQQDLSEYNSYAFQLYATFVASSLELKENYMLLARSLLENQQNWSKEMKYLIPALSVYLMTIISKHPEQVLQYLDNLKELICHLLSSEMRMEKSAL